jgi:hypothetical protein
MIVTRKEKETNQQVLRRFNRLIQQDTKLKKVRDRKNFIKEPNRFARLQSALRKIQLRDDKQWY